MAAFALHLSVLSGEWKFRCGVIKCRGLPTLGDVAGAAVGSKAALVFVFCLMTGHTITRSAFKGAVDVTGIAFQIGVLPIKNDS